MQFILKPILGPKKVIEDLSGRVAVVAGGAFGIGYEVSRAFVLNGARVIMINRKEHQGQAAIDKIKEEAGKDAKVEWVPCDMGSLSQIRETAFHHVRKEEWLDLGETSDGIDRHFQENWLGQFYLCNLLYPLVRKTSNMTDTPAPRIVFESSSQHRMAPSDVRFQSIEEINNTHLGPLELYGRSKLAIILGVKYRILEKVIRPNQDNIYALSVHPGAVNTPMQQQWKDAYPRLFGKLLTTLMLVSGRDVEQGSYSALYAAISAEVEEKSWNGYHQEDPGKPGKESNQASDFQLGAALWDLSGRIIGGELVEDALADWHSTIQIAQGDIN